MPSQQISSYTASRRLDQILVAVSLVIASTLTGASVQAADHLPDSSKSHKIAFGQERKDGRNFMTARVNTEASPQQVWTAINEAPKYDDHLLKRKVLQEGPTGKVVQEEFGGIPLIGKTTCIVETEEIRDTKLTYHLVRSNHIKSLDAVWLLSYDKDTKETTIEIRCALEIKCFCPQMLLDRITRERIQTQLSWVKRYAESPRQTIACSADQ